MDIHFYIVTPIVLFVQVFDTGFISHVIWMGFDYLYISLYIYSSKRKWPHHTKTLFHDLVMYYIYLYRGKRCQPRKPLLLIWYENRNNIFVKNIYLNSCLIFDLLAVIYKCFEFEFFLFVFRQVCIVIYSYRTLRCSDFFHSWINYNKIVWIFPSSMAQ